MSMFHWPEDDDGIRLDPTYWGNDQDGDPGDKNVKFTSIPRRASAIIIDWVLPFVAMLIVGNGLFSDIVFLAMLANGIIWQGLTGQSLGKRAMGLKLAYVPEKKDTTTWTFVLPGVTRCAIRYVLHILDLICFIGFFKCLMNRWGKSFADEICKTVVIADKRFDLVTLAEAAALRLQILFRLQGRHDFPAWRPCGVYSGVSLLCISSTASRSICS